MEKSKIKVVKNTTQKCEAKYFASIKMCDCGNTIDAKFCKMKPTAKFYTKRIDAEHYVDIRTGEVFEYKKEYLRSIDSFFKIKRIINFNFNGTSNEMFITFTYSKMMFDNQKIVGDFKAFWRKFKKVYPNCEYVRIAEPNDCGAWHIHCLVKDTQNEILNISNKELTKLWGLGGVYSESITNVYGLSNYFIPSFNKNASEKAQRKAIRLKYYTKNFRSLSYSKGIIVPKFVEVEYEEFCKLIENYSIKYSSGDKDILEICRDGKKKCLNTIRFEEYINKNSKASKFTPELLGKEADE